MYHYDVRHFLARPRGWTSLTSRRAPGFPPARREASRESLGADPIKDSMRYTYVRHGASRCVALVCASGEVMEVPVWEGGRIGPYKGRGGARVRLGGDDVGDAPRAIDFISGVLGGSRSGVIWKVTFVSVVGEYAVRAQGR